MCPVCRKIYFKHPEPTCECEKNKETKPSEVAPASTKKKKKAKKYPSIKELQQWRATVMSRDLNTCRHCGKKGKVAHHIKPKSKYKKLALDIENGVTLCHTCHGQEHQMSIDEATGLFMPRIKVKGGSPGGDSKNRNTSG
jgi:5-methylcytosine-specific restriction endonuclease McrA